MFGSQKQLVSRLASPVTHGNAVSLREDVAEAVRVRVTTCDRDLPDGSGCGGEQPFDFRKTLLFKRRTY